MPLKPRTFSPFETEFMNLRAVNELAEELDVSPVQLADLYNVIRIRWQDSAGDVISNYEYLGQDPLKAYNNDPHWMVAEAVFACGVEIVGRMPCDWTEADFRERMGWLMDSKSPHYYDTIDIARRTIKASGYSLY